MSDSGSLAALNHFFLVQFFGSRLGDLHGQVGGVFFSAALLFPPPPQPLSSKGFVYSLPVKETSSVLAARITADLKLRFPQSTVEQIPSDLEAEAGENKLCFKLWEVKPYLPAQPEALVEPLKKRMTLSHKAEDLMSSLDKLFNCISIDMFIEHKTARPNVLAVHQLEVPFTDLESKRIPVAKSFEKELAPLENACTLIVM